MGRLTNYLLGVRQSNALDLAMGHGKAFSIALKLSKPAINNYKYMCIQGGQLWMVYKNVCFNSVEKMEKIIKAWYTGYIGTSEIKSVLNFKMDIKKFWHKVNKVGNWKWRYEKD